MNYQPRVIVKTVTAAGTPEPVTAADKLVRGRVIIRALQANTSDVYYGGSDLDSTHRAALAPGQADTIETHGDGSGYFNLKLLYVDAAVTAEGFQITYIESAEAVL
jgi:hypothetical protein